MYLACHTISRLIHVIFVPPIRLYCTNLLPELTLPTALSVVLLLQSGIHLALTLSLVLHLLYLSLPLRHSYSVRHLGLVSSHDHNLSVSASEVLRQNSRDVWHRFLRARFPFCTQPSVKKHRSKLKALTQTSLTHCQCLSSFLHRPMYS